MSPKEAQNSGQFVSVCAFLWPTTPLSSAPVPPLFEMPQLFLRGGAELGDARRNRLQILGRCMNRAEQIACDIQSLFRLTAQLCRDEIERDQYSRLDQHRDGGERNENG